MTPRGSLRSRIHGDERGIVLGCLVRTVLVLALVAFAAVEATQVLVAQIHAQSAARSAAQAAADTWATKHHSADALHAAAQAAAREVDAGAVVESVEVDDQGLATVRVREVAHTLLVQHVSFLEHFGVQRATDTQGRSP